ncbi:MAG: hypothetical protein HGA33_00430 [Candidatus Moranbacteria bacterium]|nr:hypothetical protein [Candidatus Moranbacteria bacterium]
MQSDFSPELVERLKNLYRKKTGQELDDGRAELFLEAYATVGMCILEGIREKRERGENKRK